MQISVQGKKDLNLQLIYLKILDITKLTIALLLAVCLQVNARSYGQSVTLSVKNRSLKASFSQIRKQTGYVFFYNHDLLKEAKPVTVDIKNKTIEEAVSACLKNQPFTFHIEDKTVFISEKKLTSFLPRLLLPPSSPDTLRGHIIDEQGVPFPGATIIVKGTGTAAISDENGDFSFELDTASDTLIIQSLGFVRQEIPVTGSTTVPLKIIIKRKINQLDDVVVIGYGKIQKKDLTGSVSVIDGKDIARQSIPNLSTALQGLAPGLMVRRSTSLPSVGNEATINIRGITTISNSSPLVIVDGIPIAHIDMINPNDIESISVLKDAASASIYGARGAAGVILIKTKQAKSDNRVSLTYTGSGGVITPTEFPGTVDYKRYMEMINEVAWNDGGNQSGDEYSVYAKDFIDDYARNHQLNPDEYPITNWKDVLLNKYAPFTRHGISLNYGNKIIKILSSTNYEHTDAIYNNSTDMRISSRINSTINITKFLSADIDMYYIHSEDNQPDINPIALAYEDGPLWTPYWSDGRISGGRQGTNHWARLNYGGFDNAWRNRFTGKFSLTLTPIKDLSVSAILAPTTLQTKEKDFTKQIPYYNADDSTTSAGFVDGNINTDLTESRPEVHGLTKQLLINYGTTFKGGHKVSAMVGYEDYYNFSETLVASSQKLALTEFPYLDRGNSNYVTNAGSASEEAYNSYLGRLTYSYKDKYLFQGNLRFDGSSRFDKNYRWGGFPSFSLGWVPTEEKFFEKLHLKGLSFLKLRGSWGKLGNDRIGNYPYQSIMNLGDVLFFGNNGDVVSSTSAYQQTYNINNITWEKTEMFDVGIDAEFLNNRLSFTGDYYKKTTHDMLLALAIPEFIGYNKPNQNAGTMYTKGWDAEIGWSDHIGGLRYSVNAHVSDYRSIMGNLAGLVFQGNQITEEGEEYDAWYGYRSSGLFQTQEEVNSSPLLSGVEKPGDVKYMDVSGPDGKPDGEISPSYDKVPLGGSLPRYLYGGSLSMEYHGFDLSVLFQGVGKELSRLDPQMVYQTVQWYTFPAYVDGNYFSNYNSAEKNKTARYPRLSQIGYEGGNYVMSDFWLINGAYFRLKNLTFGYTLPQKTLAPTKIEEVRFYGSVTNLFSVDHYPAGWDPEAGLSGYIARTWTIGLSIKL